MSKIKNINNASFKLDTYMACDFPNRPPMLKITTQSWIKLPECPSSIYWEKISSDGQDYISKKDTKVITLNMTRLFPSVDVVIFKGTRFNTYFFFDHNANYRIRTSLFLYTLVVLFPQLYIIVLCLL